MGNGLSEYDAELVATMTSLESAVYDTDVAFRIALLGDWSGRTNQGLLASSLEIEDLRPILVDRDNLDQVMARVGPKLQLQLDDSGNALTLNFKELADFHPDRLFAQLEIFESLQKTRAQLSNQKTFAEAAAIVRGWSDSSETDNSQERIAPIAVTEEPPPPGNNSGISQGGLLDQILAGVSSDSEAPADSSPSKPATQPISPEISALAREAVKPYVSPDNEAERELLTEAVDTSIAAIMNGILHHPDFQALESAWRALDFLVNRLETGTTLKLYLLDISFEELRADLRSDKDYRNSALYKLAVEQTVGTAGGHPWALLAGNYTFDFSNADPGIIESISRLTQEARAPFVAGATSRLLGCASLSETPDPDDWQTPLDSQVEAWWESVRSIPSAAYVGFGLPRFLLRLPYGKKTEPTEEFDFEEMPDSEHLAIDRRDRHESYLWANPAFAMALLLARGFSKNGWDFRPSDDLEIEGLPMHVYEHDGDTEIKPCAEVLLTLRAAEQIIDRGLMPLISMKGSDTIRLGMFQSIAGSRLGGPWNR